MKKIISSILLTIIILSVVDATVFSVSESALSGNTKENIATTDEKITSDVDINDDFESDSVLVVINNAESRELKEYTIEDFPEISAASVENLSVYIEEKIKNQRSEISVQGISKEDLLRKDPFYINEDNFHQVLLVKLNSKSKVNVLKSIKILEVRDDVYFASPNYLWTICGEPNDEEYINGDQWAIDTIKLPDAWNITTGSEEVLVGVIDTGISGTHPDLIDNINVSLSKDFTGGNSPLTDTHGHGTSVAGIIGAQGNNAKGITGVCWDVGLVSLKTSTSGTMSSGNIFNALSYAQLNNISIINFSAGIDDPYGLWCERWISELSQYSGLIVCSAGNNSVDISNPDTPSYPSCFDLSNTISVAASSETDGLFYGSNYSSEYVNLAAPGDNVNTTIKNGDYGRLSYTSFATPHVTGVAALLKSKYPEMSYAALKYYIEAGVDKSSAFKDKVATGGRLNAYKSLNKVTEYTIIYNANGGTGTMADTAVIYANRTPLRANQFTKNGMYFECWHAKRASDNKWYYTNGTSKGWYLEGQQPSGYYKYPYSDQHTVWNTTAVDGDVVTMYAQWNSMYTIKFNGNSGTGSMQDMIVQSNVPMQLSSNTFVKNRFVFDHWYAKNTDGETYCTGSNGAGWYLTNEKPSGYTRKVFSDNAYIHAETIIGLNSGDTITMYAYWEPTFGVLGDADMNGSVAVKDATLIQKYVAELATLTNDQILLADVDYSGKVNVTDATKIQKYVSDLIDYFE